MVLKCKDKKKKLNVTFDKIYNKVYLPNIYRILLLK